MRDKRSRTDRRAAADAAYEGARRASIRFKGQRLAAVAALVVLLAAPALPAGGAPTPTLGPTATASPSPGAPASSPAASPGTYQTAAAAIGPVVWATAIDPNTKAPRQRVTSFPATAQTIYATLEIPRITRGTALAATWAYNNTPLPSLDSSVTATADAESVWVEFHLSLKSGVAATPPLQPGTWPAGMYRITVSVNGQAAQTATVMVGERRG